MNLTDELLLIHQAKYAKEIRLLLPAEAFSIDPSKLTILLINLAILVSGWVLTSYLDQWPSRLLWLFLPFAIVMGNSVLVLLFATHALMHGSVIRNRRLAYGLSLLGLTTWWMPPTLWKAVHNCEHHNKTNSIDDPDRNYTYQQPNTWGKWIQNAFVPSVEVSLPGLVVGMIMSWGVHGMRNLTSVILFNRKSVAYVPAAFTVSPKDRRRITQEFFLILLLHLAVMAYLDFDPLKLLLGYFLPIAIGHAGGMFYIFTNHLICRWTDVNDPLANTVSLRVPKILDLLHLNFSYHTEHHVFPSMNSDYYPLLQSILQERYAGRYNLLKAGEAWRLLLQTPRHYKDEMTLTNWSGSQSTVCPLRQTQNSQAKDLPS